MSPHDEAIESISGYWIHFLWSAATCRVGNQVITNHPRILRQEEGGETGRGMSYGRGTLTVRHWSWELQLAGGRVMIMERAGHHLSACSSSSNDSGFYLFNLSLIAGVWFEFQLSYVTEGQFLSMLWKKHSMGPLNGNFFKSSRSISKIFPLLMTKWWSQLWQGIPLTPGAGLRHAGDIGHPHHRHHRVPGDRYQNSWYSVDIIQHGQAGLVSAH